MEEKGREASPSLANADAGPPETLGEVSRRRPGGSKRKAPSGNSSFSSTPSKRLAKERNNPHGFLPPIHNGPVTRARQSPNKLAAAAAAAAADPNTGNASGQVASGKGGNVSGDGIAEEDEELELPEVPVVDEEFEAIRSRGSGVHVVPTHAGWFTWKKVHPLEERTMASFFNGKLENRTCDIYMEIRNSILKKFHADPQTQVELSDLSEISAGDSDARQEVFEFLDYWGLINFHPFPPLSSDASAPETDGAAKTASLVEKLYQFETVRAPSRVGAKRVSSSAPAVPAPRLLPESALSEDVVRPEEPSVEYHCNSCSGDCSHKRYHCQKQADFDLCSECYSAEKFGPGMVATDFILMESAEARGVSGGSWTDQETLLLLEALELFGENWSEIAEHVATKTKAQCILHFVQMPIEDPFLEGSDDPVDILSKITDPGTASTTKEAAAPDVPEATESRSAENGDQAAPTPKDTSERKDDGETEMAQESSANIAIDALKAAFQSVGSLLEQGGLPSFAEAGNPVMALAAFLAGLVESSAATTSIRSSLKAMSEESPGIQLATRHCFSLEDPPNDSKAQPKDSENPPNTERDDKKEENQVLVVNGSDGSKENTDMNGEKPVAAKKELPDTTGECSPNQNVKEPRELASPAKDTATKAVGESGDSSLPAEQVACVVKDSDDLALQGETTASAMKVSGDLPLQEDGTAKDLPEEEKTNSAKDSGAVTSSDVVKNCSETSMAVDIVSTLAAPEEKEIAQTVDSTVETGERAGNGDAKGEFDEADKNGSLDETGDDHSLNRVRCAAATALSAAAVKAKVLAKHEEEQIRQIVSLMIEKQLQKLEIKLALCTDIEGVIMRVREQLDRARKRFYHERAQIIAARFGFPASSSRPLNMAAQKPPIKKP